MNKNLEIKRVSILFWSIVFSIPFLLYNCGDPTQTFILRGELVKTGIGAGYPGKTECDFGATQIWIEAKDAIIAAQDIHAETKQAEWSDADKALLKDPTVREALGDRVPLYCAAQIEMEVPSYPMYKVIIGKSEFVISHQKLENQDFKLNLKINGTK